MPLITIRQTGGLRVYVPSSSALLLVFSFCPRVSPNPSDLCMLSKIIRVPDRFERSTNSNKKQYATSNGTAQERQLFRVRLMPERVSCSGRTEKGRRSGSYLPIRNLKRRRVLCAFGCYYSKSATITVLRYMAGIIVRWRSTFFTSSRRRARG